MSLFYKLQNFRTEGPLGITHLRSDVMVICYDNFSVLFVVFHHYPTFPVTSFDGEEN